ncbi:MAG: hypothetical protein IJS87_02405 [Rhodocyclaceae bacterium]|nr:hypothetical protein [Rhodocyclaceae bacterium]
MTEAVTDEMDTLRREAIMETVDVIQRAVWLFMHAQRQAQDCATLAYRMAAMIYGYLSQSQNAAWWGRMDAAIENCADITGQECAAMRDDCPYAGRLCDCEAMDCPAACDCETCPDKDACKCC